MVFRRQQFRENRDQPRPRPAPAPTPRPRPGQCPWLFGVFLVSAHGFGQQQRYRDPCPFRRGETHVSDEGLIQWATFNQRILPSWVGTASDMRRIQSAIEAVDRAIEDERRRSPSPGENEVGLPDDPNYRPTPALVLIHPGRDW
jgi:hypothetical protein